MHHKRRVLVRGLIYDSNEIKFAVLFSKGAILCDCKMSEASQYQIAEEQITIFTQKNRSHAT